MRNSERGFSLIEVLLIVVLGATLATLAVPPVRRNIAYYRLSSSANLLAAELNMARTLAVSRGTAYEITLDNINGDFQIVDPDDPESPPRAVKVLEEGVFFSVTPGTPIRFFSRGHARAGTIRLENEFGNTIEVDVQASGTVRTRNTETS